MQKEQIEQIESKKVLITCDSTCDLSPELQARYNINMMSFPVIMDGVSYKDGENVIPDDLFKFFETTGKLPSTSAPNPGEFADFFEQYTKEGYAIVHFSIGSALSCGHINARNAAATLEDVYVVDSQSLSTGGALLAIKAAELAQQGYSAKEIAELVAPMAVRMDVSFVIDTLQFLYKGGRCSALSALGANLLKLKPCIEVRPAGMDVGKKYRGKIADVLPGYVEARLTGRSNIDFSRIFITHSGCDQSIIDAVEGKIRELADFNEIIVTRAGCTISVHCGPNTLGILFMYQ